MWHWSVLLAHPTWLARTCDFRKCKRTPLVVDFESSRSHYKIRILKQSKFTLLCCVSHTTVLSVFTCVMNVWDQTHQAFVTRFCPFCNWTGEFIRRPQNVRSPSTSQIQIFEEQFMNILVDSSPTDSFSSSLNWWSSMHGVCDFV